MKLNVAGTKATGSGVSGSSEFTMSMNAKAFHTLSSTLYSDSFGAIVREICSNAYDAHIMAGTPERPFNLTFPDRLNSELVIRDFGPGISPEDITNVYCRFFESTKDQSNDAVGAFGLGSKTPFSYTDTFTVTSIHEGVKYIYTAFKDEGMPNLKLMVETETDEESGLEVSIPVHLQDFASFEQAVIRELRFFPVKPTSNRDWSWGEMETTMDFGHVQFYKTDSSHLRGFFVQIGPVGYRIDRSLIENHCNRNDITLTAMARHLLAMGGSHGYDHRNNDSQNAMLNMPIGTVEVQPSREGLHYTKDTCNNIIETICEAEKMVASETVTRIDDAFAESPKTFYNTITEMPKFISSTLSTLQDFNTKYAPFTIGEGGGIDVTWDDSVIGYDKTILGKIAPSRHRSSSGPDKTHTIYLTETLEDHRGAIIKRHRGLELFNADTVYFKDEAFAYKSRIREEDKSKVSYFLEPGEGQNVDDLFAYFEQFLNIRRVSDLPKKVNKKGSSTTNGRTRSWFELGEFLSERKVATFNCYNTLYAHGAASVFGEDLDDLTEPTVVVRTLNNAVIFEDDDDLFKKLRLAAMLHEAGYKVIAVAKSVKYDNENVCELDDLTDDHHKALRVLLDNVRVIRALESVQTFGEKYNSTIEQMIELGFLSRDLANLFVDIDPIQKALSGYPTLNARRDADDFKVAKEASDADSFDLGFEDFDELFEVVNDHLRKEIELPSELASKIKDKFSLKNGLTALISGDRYKLSYCELRVENELVVNRFSISPTTWLNEFVKGLD